MASEHPVTRRAQFGVEGSGDNEPRRLDDHPRWGQSWQPNGEFNFDDQPNKTLDAASCEENEQCPRSAFRNNVPLSPI